MSETTKQSEVERRRFRAAGAFHIASALVRTFGEDHPSIEKITIRSIKIADSILDALDATENVDYPEHWKYFV